MSARWHILREGDSVTLARHLPPRFDVAATTHLPHGRATRLAHQIRQDMWRAVAHVRGFSPVVRLDRTPEGWAVTAGGRAMGRVPDSVRQRIAAILGDPSKRTRWVANAQASK